LAILGRALGKESKHSEKAKEWFYEEEWKVWGNRSIFGSTEYWTTHSRKPESPQNK